MGQFGCRVGDVCFVHWPVDPDVLATRLPHALSVATKDGAGWVSLLGMRTRPAVGPLSLPGEFSQVTLRTYVRAGEEGEDAVHFLRVDVDSRPVAAGARRLFDIPFRCVDATVAPDGDEVRVATDAPGGPTLYDATVRRRGEVRLVEADSLVGWLTDRDVYALDDGRTGTVERDPWRLAEAEITVRTDEILSSEGLPAPAGEPLVRYSPGTAIRLRSWPS